MGKNDTPRSTPPTANSLASSPLPSSPQMPAQGWSTDETLARLEALRRDDVRWKEGRAFSLAYFASPEAHELATEAYRRFSGENALNVEAFPNRKSTRLNSSHVSESRMPSSA